MKTLKAIPYQLGYIFVDGSEIKEGDWFYSVKPRTADKAFGSNISEWWKTVCEGNESARWFNKIIAQHNLNLEGIPYVELEEDVEDIIESIVDRETSAELGSPIRSTYKRYCLLGYKSAKARQYTEDDLRKAIDMARSQKSSYAMSTGGFDFEDDEIIQSLQPKIESIEIEMYNGNTDEPLTYLKDGKIYLKVAKINYQEG